MSEKSGRTRPRKLPQQERSIQRVDAILAAATEIIAIKGMAELKMTDVAAGAGVPIGSVYQYFPEKAAIMRALFDRRETAMAQLTASHLGGARTQANALDAIERLLDDVCNIYFSDPAFLSIWLGTIADKDLQPLQLRFCQRVNDVFLANLAPLFPAGSCIDLEARCMMVGLMLGSALRFSALGQVDLAQRVVYECKSAIRHALFKEPAP